jgi:chromosome partitioning protein
MSNVIAVSNHKGGVGKTTSTINIGFGLLKLKKRVLLIDLDPQANLTQSLGVTNTVKNIYGVLKKQYPAQPLPVVQNLDIIPSTIDLSGVEIELSSEIGREFVLKEAIQPIRNSYDYILIDCPPSLGLLTINAFTTANEVYIPLQAEYLALQGLSKMVDVISKIQKFLNGSLLIGGVFVTQYDSRKVLNRNIVESIEDYFSQNVFSTKIRDNIALAEAPSACLDIFRYQPSCNGALDYLALCEEIINKKNK